MNKLLIICGPTATGKTKLAIDLAKKFNGELMNADSRQVYKGLDALTGKDRSEDIPIRLYDIVNPTDEFSVAHFVRLAHVAIDDISNRGKLPIIVGGTGFYLRALTREIDTIAIPPNQTLRKRLYAVSLTDLQDELQRVDPERWEKMNDSDRKNPRRLIRAIEVADAAGTTSGDVLPSDVLWIGLTAPLSVLKNRIAKRVWERLEKATTEVRGGLPPILGVDPLLSYVRGEKTKEDAISQWIQAEYAYARRQMTWFKNEPGIIWFDVAEPIYLQNVEDMVQKWYTEVR